MLIHASRQTARFFLAVASIGSVLLLAAAGPVSAQGAHDDDFSIVLLPDTQYYFNNELPNENDTDGIYDDQTCWIAKKKALYQNSPPLPGGENIQFAIHLGDITDNASASQFETAREAHDILWKPDLYWPAECGTKPSFPSDPANPLQPPGSVRFSVLPGNHDGSPEFTTFNEDSMFGPDAFDCFMHGPDCANKYAYGGSIEPTGNPPLDAGRNEANYQTFDVEDVKFLVLNLPSRNRSTAEFYDVPSKDDICWANDIVEQHPDRHVIVATHGYTAETSYNAWENSCPRRTSGRISGADTLYEELLARHSNISMILSGHIGDSEHRTRLRDVDGDGSIDQSLHEILTDYQFEDPQPGSGGICYTDGNCSGDPHCHSGNGWLRLLNFSPAENHVYARIETTIDQDDDSADDARWFGEMFPKADVGHWLNHCSPYHSIPTHPNHQFDFPYDLSTVPTAHDQDSTTFRDRWVNETGSGDQEDSAVATDADGNFVVAWVDYSDGNSQIRMRGFDKFGCERFPETGVDLTGNIQRNPRVAMDAAGNFVVTWDEIINSYSDIRLRGVSSLYDGEDYLTHATPVVTPHDTPADDKNQIEPDVALTDDGELVVVWQDDKDGNGYYNIYGMTYTLETTGGLTLDPWWAGAVSMHPSLSSDQQLKPSVAVESGGEFMVTYQDDNDNNNRYQILAVGWDFGAEDSTPGTPAFPIFTVNTDSSGQQYDPRIAMDGSGRFVIAWRNDHNNNDVYDVFMRGFERNGSTWSEWFPQEAVKAENHPQDWPTVAMAAPPPGADEGFFVVSWQDDSDDNQAYEIRASGYRYNLALGSKVNDFNDLSVNWDSSGDQRETRAAMAPNGDFVVTWSDDRDDNTYWEIMARGLEWSDLLDGDSDGYKDGWDNCPDFASANQDDADGDGIGNVCDPCPFAAVDRECDFALSDLGELGQQGDVGSLVAGGVEVNVIDPDTGLPGVFLRGPDFDGDNGDVDLCVVISGHPPRSEVESHLGLAHAVIEATIQSDFKPVDVILKWDDADDDGLVDDPSGGSQGVFPESLLVVSRDGRAIGSLGQCQNDSNCDMTTNQWLLPGAGHGEYMLFAQVGAGAVGTDPLADDDLVLDRTPEGAVLLQWPGSCWGADDDYAVYAGALGDFDSHVELTCSTGSCDPDPAVGCRYEADLGSGDVYYLVVPQSRFGYEGSYGRNSLGNERPQSTAACAGRQQELVDCP